MNARDRALAEAVLRRIMVGTSVGGIRFGPVLQLLLGDERAGDSRLQGPGYINLGSAWQVFPARPETFPRGEAEVPERSVAEELRELCDLREAPNIDAELASDAPDPIVTLADGRVFFMCGRDERYEPWQAGVAYGDSGARWLVVACPGNEVAVWAPAEFASAPPAL